MGVTRTMRGADARRDEPAEAGGAALSVSKSLLGFLDRHLDRFPRGVRSAIGIIVAVLLFIVVLHAAVAPTYIEGHLFVQADGATLKSPGTGYWFLRGNERFLVNDNAYWMIPLRGGIMPRRMTVQLLDREGHATGRELSFWGPWPVLSALYAPEYNVTVHADRQVGRGDIEITEATPAPSPLALLGVGTAYAQGLGAYGTAVQVHVEGLGDIGCAWNAWCGTRGEARRLEGFALHLPRGLGDVRLRYRCQGQDEPMSGWLREGEFCGTRGQARPLQALVIELEGTDARLYDLSYQVHVQARGDSELLHAGARAGAPYRRIEALRVSLAKR